MKLRISVAAALGAVAATPALAHISYTGRNFGTVTAATKTTIGNQTVNGNYGWADAADGSLSFDSVLALSRTDPASDETPGTADSLYFGDSHKGRAFRFHLDTTLEVMITASEYRESGKNPGLLPGFSVYKGLAAVSPFTPPQTSADYDFNAASRSWRTNWAAAQLGAGYGWGATQGSWNALGDWAIGGDGDEKAGGALSHFQYMGSAAEAGGAHTVTGSFVLGPGEYTIFVGGNDIANKASLEAAKAYGLQVNIMAHPVPEPETYAMFLAGLGILARVAHRRRG